MKQVQKGGDNCHMVQIGGDSEERAVFDRRDRALGWLIRAALACVVVGLIVLVAIR